MRIAYETAWSFFCPRNPTLETAVLYSNISAIDALLTSPSCRPELPFEALVLSACHFKLVPLSHLLDTYPSLRAQLGHREFLLAALDNPCITMWKIIVAYRPEVMRGRVFGHAGSLVEHCVRGGHLDLLRLLLREGASVENEHRPIMILARLGDASEEIKDLLVAHGARTRFDAEDEEILAKEGK